MILHSMQNALFFSKGIRNLTLSVNYPSLLKWIVSHQQKKYPVIAPPRYTSCTRLPGIWLLAKHRPKAKATLPSYPWLVQAKGGGTTSIPKVRQTCSYGCILGAESDTSEKIQFLTLGWTIGKSQGKKNKTKTNKNPNQKFLTIWL